MPTVFFIGLGLNNEKGISLEGLESARGSNRIFLEFYTNPMPELDLGNLEHLVGKKVTALARKDLEDDGGKQVEEAVAHGQVAFLVPGDPMIATTHVALRLSLAKKGVNTRVIHAASIVSAVSGATGLQNYKFGKSITLPAEGPCPPSVIDTLNGNKERNLHTLLLLDVRPNQREQLLVPKALDKLTRASPEIADWLAVGVARVGSHDEDIKAARVRRLSRHEFGGPPHSLVFPSSLHFMEEEALRTFCGATKEDFEGAQ